MSGDLHVWWLVCVVRRLMFVVLRVACWLLCIVFLVFVCGSLSVVGCCVLFGVWWLLNVAWCLLFVVCMLSLCVLCFVCCLRFDVCSCVRSVFVVCCLLLVD